MDPQTAALLLRSLGQRRSDDYRLAESISELEWQAVEFAVQNLAASPAPPPPSDIPGEDPPEAVFGGLNLASIENRQVQDPEIVLCLDYGSSSGKAAALHHEEGLITLFGQNQQPGTLSSSLAIDHQGIFRFGAAAEEAQKHPQSLYIGSLKQKLSAIGAGQVLSSLQAPVYPDWPLSLRQSLLLQLAYLTENALRELKALGYGRYLLRRFSLPCWRRAAWLELKPELMRLFAEAQIVADTFQGRFESGVHFSEYLEALQALKSEDQRPNYLVGRSVAEPIAAGASRFDAQRPFQGLVLFVDIGAGTTDMALMVVVSEPEQNYFTALPVPDGTEWLPMAGDYLDQALLDYLRRLHPGDYPSSALQIRALKETLFREECVNIEETGETIYLDSFMEFEACQKYASQLRLRLEKLLSRLPLSILEKASETGLTVCLSGGGATLPMVKKLQSGEIELGGYKLQLQPGPQVPGHLQDLDLSEANYAQLAVAIGGTSSYLPKEGRTLSQWPELPRKAPG